MANDLTVSNIDHRQNILNNPYAVAEIQRKRRAETKTVECDSARH